MAAFLLPKGGSLLSTAPTVPSLLNRHIITLPRNSRTPTTIRIASGYRVQSLVQLSSAADKQMMQRRYQDSPVMPLVDPLNVSEAR